MSNIPQYTPEEINAILKNRLNSTNFLWSKRDKDSVEQERVLFFKYYFDFASAIEAALRGIIYEYSLMSLSGMAMKAFGKPQDSCVAFLVKKDDFKAITNESKILECTNESEYEVFLKYISMFEHSVIKKNFIEKEAVYNAYDKIRKTRNILAHGLKAMDENVDFSQSVLSDFVYIFYLTFNYYKRIYNDRMSA